MPEHHNRYHAITLINVLEHVPDPVVMLATVPEMLAIYRRLGIPADLYRDTISDLRRGMDTDDD
ncbi:MAG: DUF5596 domain-containing protein, partial [Methanoregulaceae archaeon]|nr:DUF5596 domain-containing protein [Methanoregulaceae archaeon]